MSHELRVDWTRCDGHGLCASLLADITLDEWGFPVIDGPVPPSRLAAARAAVAACPALALRLEPATARPAART